MGDNYCSLATTATSATTQTALYFSWYTVNAPYIFKALQLSPKIVTWVLGKLCIYICCYRTFQSGGAIALRISTTVYTTGNLTFIKNKAKFGGAMLVMQSQIDNTNSNEFLI